MPKLTKREHDWIERFGLNCCRKCGIVQRADGLNNPCPGPIRVELRQNRISGRAALQQNGEAG
jgi:hypothetical protein